MENVSCLQPQNAQYGIEHLLFSAQPAALSDFFFLDGLVKFTPAPGESRRKLPADCCVSLRFLTGCRSTKLGERGNVEFGANAERENPWRHAL